MKQAWCFLMIITFQNLTEIFKDKIAELQGEPEFNWSGEKIKYAVENNDEPAVKLAVGNVPLDYDLWEGLRNPAVVGLHPIGLQEIWEFYANRRKERIDETGRQTIFQIPRSFDFARKYYRRAVIVSVMLPFSIQDVRDFTQLFPEKRRGSSHLFSRIYRDVNLILDKVVTRVAIDLVSEDNAVVAMDNDTVKNVSMEAVPPTYQEASHGPAKGGNYPQKSVAVLMGLGQFCVNRIVVRDEVVNGKVQRFTGPIRSIIIFDKKDLIIDGSNGIIYPTTHWREFLFKLFDFTNTDPEINKYRFCTYFPYDDESCKKCLTNCPSGAQANSVPTNSGKYSENVLKQTHRFWNDKLQFDYDRCCDDRGRMTGLLPEWSCGRCISICTTEGNRRTYAAENFYRKIFELTKTQ